MSRIKLRKGPRRQVQIYLLRVFRPPPSLLRAHIHLIFAYDVPGTEDVGLNHQIPVQCWASVAAHCWFDRLRRWPNTNLSPVLVYTLRKHVAFNQCCFNVDPQSSALARH